MLLLLRCIYLPIVIAIKVKAIEERIAKLNEREQRNRLKALRREKEFGGMNAYLLYLNRRKQDSIGDAHKIGLGWQL